MKAFDMEPITIKVNELREGDKFRSTNPKVNGEGIVIAHVTVNGFTARLVVIWEGLFIRLDDMDNVWVRDCLVVSRDNDVSEYQKKFRLESKNLTTTDE